MEPVSHRKYEWTRFWFIILIGVIACILFSIAFFVFTVGMSHPTSMKLVLPKDTDTAVHVSKTNPEGALTLLLGRHDVIYFYEGQLALNGANLKESDYTRIRKIILDKKARTDEKDFVVVIKPAEGASYKNTVDILDEMTINDVKRYAMVDISPAENETINKK